MWTRLTRANQTLDEGKNTFTNGNKNNLIDSIIIDKNTLTIRHRIPKKELTKDPGFQKAQEKVPQQDGKSVSNESKSDADKNMRLIAYQLISPANLLKARATTSHANIATATFTSLIKKAKELNELEIDTIEKPVKLCYPAIQISLTSPNLDHYLQIIGNITELEQERNKEVFKEICTLAQAFEAKPIPLPSVQDKEICNATQNTDTKPAPPSTPSAKAKPSSSTAQSVSTSQFSLTPPQAISPVMTATPKRPQQNNNKSRRR